jgi:hypothetical protein
LLGTKRIAEADLSCRRFVCTTDLIITLAMTKVALISGVTGKDGADLAQPNAPEIRSCS